MKGMETGEKIEPVIIDRRRKCKMRNRLRDLEKLNNHYKNGTLER